jgi:hypothetical protein
MVGALKHSLKYSWAEHLVVSLDVDIVSFVWAKDTMAQGLRGEWLVG